jgi:endonuclease-3
MTASSPFSPLNDTAHVALFFQRLSQAISNPETELHYSNPYTLLVAVVLSAQSTDRGVNKATAGLFPMADSPEKMLALGEVGLKEKIKTIGLFNTKAKNILALSRILVDNYGGEIPQTREELEALPGVGRKTANVVLNVAFGHPTLPVDTHIFRVANRTGLAGGKTPLAVELELERKVPPIFKPQAHHLLILHGRYTCRARAPLCPTCPVKDLCAFYLQRDLQEGAPR